MFKSIFSRRQTNLIPRPSRHEYRYGCKEFLYGNVWVRVWENRDNSGNVYHRLSIDRLARQGRKVRVTNSYSLADIPDILTGLARAGRWM